jgi:hypothetical protein
MATVHMDGDGSNLSMMYRKIEGEVISVVVLRPHPEDYVNVGSICLTLTRGQKILTVLMVIVLIIPQDLIVIRDLLTRKKTKNTQRVSYDMLL